MGTIAGLFGNWALGVLRKSYSVATEGEHRISLAFNELQRLTVNISGLFRNHGHVCGYESQVRNWTGASSSE